MQVNKMQVFGIIALFWFFGFEICHAYSPVLEDVHPIVKIEGITVEDISVMEGIKNIDVESMKASLLKPVYIGNHQLNTVSCLY